MTRVRDEYSEELESEYRRVERAYKKVVADFDAPSFSKSSEELLDSVFDFCKLAYHLKEWIREDTKVSQSIKKQIPSFLDKGLESGNPDLCLPICRDLVNWKKHRVFNDKYTPNDPNIKISTLGHANFLVSNSDMRMAREFKQSVHLKMEDSLFSGRIMVSYRGNGYEVRWVVEYCMLFWEDFFTKNNLLMPRIF